MITITATRSLKLAETSFHRGVPLHSILVDGWSRGLHPEQVQHECIQMGYALCVAEPERLKVWARLDHELAEYEKTQVLNYNPTAFDVLQAYGYTLSYTDECGTERELEFLAAHDIQAMAIAQHHCRGNEGLWSGICLSGGPTDDAIDFTPF